MALPAIRGWKGIFGPNTTRVFSYLRPERHWLLVIGGLGLLYLPLSLVEPYLMIYLIDKVIIGERLDLLPHLATRLLPFFLLYTSVDFLLSYTVLHVARQLQTGIKLVQLENLLRKSFSFFQNLASGKVLYAFFNDSSQIGSFLSLGLVSSALQLLFVLARIAILAYIDRTLVLVSLIVTPIQAAVLYKVMKMAMGFEIDIKKRDEDLTSGIEEMLRGSLVVRAFSFTGPLATAWMKRFDQRLGVDFKNMVWRQVGSTVVGNLQLLGLFIILFMGAYKVADGSLTLGSLIAFTAVSSRVAPSIQALIGFFVGAQETFVNIERYYRIHDHADEDGEFAASLVGAGAVGTQTLDEAQLSDIRVNDVRVDFGYGKAISVPCDFRLEPGQSCLWYGSNGAGKTSVALALAGLVPHRAGSISLGGRPLSDFSLQSVRDRILYVGADPFWPERTLAGNFGNREGEAALDEERLREAMWASTAGEVLDSLPKGMNTVLSSNAHILSRGENQRLFLAMALYRRPQVLILDESLSSVSDQHLRRILERTRSVGGDRFIIHVSHRRKHFEECDAEVAFRSLV